jgi:hypothetical protein
MSGIDYHQVRQQASMTQVLDLIGFQATRRHGPQLRGPCPIPDCCSSSRRAFSVHLTRQVYHCFACRSHGNPPLPWLLNSSTTSTVSEPQPVPFRAPSRNH